MDNILNHPLLNDLTLERAVNYAVEFIRIVGMPQLFIEKTENINIQEYRALLPCDYLEMIQVKYHNHCIRYSTDSFHVSRNHYLDNERIENKIEDETYKIQGNVIFTSFKEGEIEIAYEAMALDKEGFPLIPDNSSFIKALELYIKKEWFIILYDMSKISYNVLANTQKQYAWYVGQAQSDLVRPTIDQMQSITNMWNTLVQRVSDHRNGFKNNGTREYIKVQ
jgi:hypothetical protein